MVPSKLPKIDNKDNNDNSTPVLVDQSLFTEKCQNWYWYIFSRMFILLNFDPNLRQQGKCDAFFRREKRPLREFG